MRRTLRVQKVNVVTRERKFFPTRLFVSARFSRFRASRACRVADCFGCTAAASKRGHTSPSWSVPPVSLRILASPNSTANGVLTTLGNVVGHEWIPDGVRRSRGAVLRFLRFDTRVRRRSYAPFRRLWSSLWPCEWSLVSYVFSPLSRVAPRFAQFRRLIESHPRRIPRRKVPATTSHW